MTIVTAKEKGVACPETGSINSSQFNSSSSMDSRDENKVRGNWTGRMDFMLSCIGYAVGLGNIWRFPYLCYSNGGGAFLIPYVIFLILCGMPMVFLEVSFGQFASLSPITVWRISPFFKGVGYGMILISGIVCIYYNIIITWTLYYLFMSFRAKLPWSTCDNEWNTDACAQRKKAELINGLMYGTNVTANNTWGYNPIAAAVREGSVNASVVTTFIANATNATVEAVKRTPSQEYWERHVLELTDGIDQPGYVRWQLFLCLLLAWVMVFLCLFKGVKSSGRVVYVTATFPYLVLFVLLIRGCTLPGALEGIKFYIIPQWEKLLEFKVWGAAAMQIFYSVGAAWGALITMSSYNKFNNNCYRDSVIVPILNCGTSIFAGFVIFSIIGFMAAETGVPIDKVVSEGPGLVFVVYPEAVSNLPISPLWAVLFFMMLLTIGVDSQFGMMETLISAVMDEYPQLLGKHMKRNKIIITGSICLVEFLLGIPCILQGGIYFLQIMDWYSSTFSLMVLSFTECMVIAWVYGVDRFCKDIELMVGIKPNVWYRICWCFITPALTVFMLVFSIVQHQPVQYGDYLYPNWAIGMGLCLALCSIIPLPICALVGIYKTEGTLVERVKELIKPSPQWGPALPQHRERYIATLSPELRQRIWPTVIRNASEMELDEKCQPFIDSLERPENERPENLHV